MPTSMREAIEAAAEKHGLVDDVEVVEQEGSAPLTHGQEAGETVKVAPESEEKPEKARPRLVNQPAEKVAKAPEVETEKEPEEAKVDHKAAKDDTTPGFLSPAAKGKWANLDPILKREIKKFERDQAVNGQSINEKLKLIEPEYAEFQRVLAPYKDQYARQGMTMPNVIHQLMSLADYASRDWAGFVREQSRMRNFDLTQLVVEQGNQQVDPNIQRLENQLRQVTQYIQGSQQQTQQQELQNVQAQIQTFQSEQDAQGNLKHPYFENVKAKMGQLMKIDPTLDLPKAYETACYADPEIRALILAEQTAAQDAQRTANLQRAQNAAKSAGGSSGGAAPVGLAKGAPMRAHLAAAFAKAEGQARIQ